MSNLSWRQNGCDWQAGSTDTCLYEIEQASENRWWTFRDGAPIGIYSSLQEAKQRADDVYKERLEGV